MRVRATCILGHRKRFRGLFVMRRVDRWWKKHEHPEYRPWTLRRHEGVK